MHELTPEEREALAAANIVVFDETIIYAAQPPIDDDTLAKVEEKCSGPLPDALVSLWRAAFGGKLDYDMRVAFGDHVAAASFAELFYPESDGYHDLWGWIEHEEGCAEEAAEESGEAWSGKLDYLPFGGFEYLERAYVRVAPGPGHGAVIYWMQGLPPAWRLRLHEDSAAKVADNIHDLFRMLQYDRDPMSTKEEFASGLELLEQLEELAGASPSGASAADKLKELIRKATLDWRLALEKGTIRDSTRLQTLALEEVLAADDVDALLEIERAGCSLEQKLRGGATVLDYALAVPAQACSRVLLDRGYPCKDGLRNAATTASPEFALELLRAGAEPDVLAAISAVHRDNLPTALVIVDALLAQDRSCARELIDEARYAQERHESTAARLVTEPHFSNTSEAQERAAADRFERLAQYVERKRKETSTLRRWFGKKKT